jgi:hypothetical protein
MPPKKFETIIQENNTSSGHFIELPFDPREEFGNGRAPVKVTINRFTFRTTVFSMGGCYKVPFNNGNRRGAGVAAGDKVKMSMELDTEPRIVETPAGLAEALKKNKKAAAAWEKMSYSHKREYAEAIMAAKRPETRRKWIARTIEALGQKRGDRKI